MKTFGTRRTRGGIVALVAVIALVGTACDVLTQANDTTRTGLYPYGELTRAQITSPQFTQLFSAQLDGAIFGQPLVLNGVLVVATEANSVYGLDANTGQVLWGPVSNGTPQSSNDIPCPDVGPTVGTTGTPVISAGTAAVYMVSKRYVSGTSGPTTFVMHARDVKTGNELPGFPVEIKGNSQNAPALAFKPQTLVQRPGLVVVDDVVYAAFGSLCDASPYTGWIAGVSINSPHLSALWSASDGDNWGPAIWQSGGGIVSDGPGQLLVITGNGYSNTTARPGSQPGIHLGNSIVRLQVQPDGTLKAVDFFSPSDAAAMDFADDDLGSAAPMVLPSTPFSTPAHPSIVAFAGKEGLLYLQDAHDLGGMKQGPGGTDKYLVRVPGATLQPDGTQTGYNWNFGKLAVWPGDGGYIYMLPMRGAASGGDNHIHAWKWGVDGSGNPTLTEVTNPATNTATYGYGSTAAVVSSDKGADGTGVLWVADYEGATSYLRAFDAVPVNGTMHQIGSWSFPGRVHFSVPAIAHGRVYVTTQAGTVLGFGIPSSG